MALITCKDRGWKGWEKKTFVFLKENKKNSLLAIVRPLPSSKKTIGCNTIISDTNENRNKNGFNVTMQFLFVGNKKRHDIDIKLALKMWSAPLWSLCWLIPWLAFRLTCPAPPSETIMCQSLRTGRGKRCRRGQSRCHGWKESASILLTLRQLPKTKCLTNGLLRQSPPSHQLPAVTAMNKWYKFTNN